MANSFNTNPIVLDDFSAAIDVNSSAGNASGTPLFVHSIEWVKPTTTTHTCTITSDSGVAVFDERCVTATQSIIKYFGGLPITNLKIAIAGVAHMASGNLHILLV
jgi:hypothetical protein